MTIANIIFYSTIAGLSTIFGTFLVRKYNNWTKRNSIYLISIAVGALLANSFFHLIPEASALSNQWTYYTFAGILLLFTTEHFITLHACTEEEHCENHTLGVVSFLGITLHSLIDGLIIGVGFEVNSVLGLLSSLAVIFHEIPEGIFTYSILKHSNLPEKQVMFYSWIVALATPVGALFSLAFIHTINKNLLGVILALAAGSFIYISASDLTPEVHKKSSFLNVIFILLGALLIMAVGKFFE
jgi:ZIP family zinc transporter/zinc and cadmium transporter